MEAGIVSYKLCDHQYECEGCSFDQILRQNAHESLARHTRSRPQKEGQTTFWGKKAIKASPENPEKTDFDHLFQTFYDFKVKEDLYYHPGHTWMDTKEPQSVTIGLNEFVVKFLLGVKTIVLPSATNRIDRGHVCCWIIEEDGTLPITAPVSGSVVATNRSVSKEPSLLMKSPYGRGWLMKIEPDDLNRDLKHLFRMDEMLVKCIDDLEKLRGTFETLLKQNWDKLGPTLCDGGNTLAHIRDIIGSKRYFHVINTFLTGR